MRRLNSFVYEESIAAGVALPRLPVFAMPHYGQCAEDLVADALVRAIARRTALDLGTQRYLEIGGNHPIAASATYLLHKRYGMSGVIVEANPALLDALTKVRPQDRVVHGAVQTEDVATVALSVASADELSSLDRSFVLGWPDKSVHEERLVDVPALRINDVIASYLDGAAPIFMSIDIEGLDLAVLQDLDFDRYRPAVIQAEPSDHHLPENSRHMAEFMESMGYVLAASTEWNLFFVDGRALMPGAVVTAEHSIWPARVRALRDEVAEAAREAEQAAAVALEAERTASEAHVRLAEMASALASARAEAAEAAASLVRVEAALQREQAALAELHASTSWKITAPLRRAMTLLR